MALKSDSYYMEKAIELAYHAEEKGDNPFGSILVDDEGNILMEDENTQITENDITGHPELKIAKRAAAEYDEEFLRKCTMYNSDGSINYSIHELLDNSGKSFEVIGPMDDMKEEVEKPHK